MNARVAFTTATLSLSAFVLAGCVNPGATEESDDTSQAVDPETTDTDSDHSAEDQADETEPEEDAAESDDSADDDPLGDDDDDAPDGLEDNDDDDDDLNADRDNDPDVGESIDGEPIDTVSGDGYSFSAPDGWLDITDAMRADLPIIDVGIIEPASSAQEFASNLNVIVEPNRGFSQDELTEQLELVSGPLLEDFETSDQSWAGQDAGVIEGNYSDLGDGDTAYMEQYAVLRDDDIVTVTLSFDPDLSDDDRDDMRGDIEDSWEWE